MPTVRIPVEIQNPNWPSSTFNVWHARTDGGAGEYELVGAALHTFYTAVADHLEGPATLVFPPSLLEVNTGEDVPWTAPTQIALAASDAAPPGIAVTVSWQTSLRARRGRGRTFLGPLDKLTIGSDGKVGTTALTSIQAAVDDLVDASTAAANWAIGIYGQQDKAIPAVKVLRDITKGTVRGNFAHLRSRRD